LAYQVVLASKRPKRRLISSHYSYYNRRKSFILNSPPALFPPVQVPRAITSNHIFEKYIYHIYTSYIPPHPILKNRHQIPTHPDQQKACERVLISRSPSLLPSATPRKPKSGSVPKKKPTKKICVQCDAMLVVTIDKMR